MRFIVLICLISLFSATPVSAEDCKECHKSPIDKPHAVHSSPDILTPVYGDTGFTRQYSKTAGQYAFNCGNCHPEKADLHNNGSLEIELYSESSSNLKQKNRKDASYNKAKKSCSGVYCHSSGESNTLTKYRETPAWGTSFGAFRCQGCHGTPPAYANEKGRVNSHFNTKRGSGHLLGIHWDATKGHTKESLSNKLSYDMGCSTCHYGTVSEDRDTTFIDTVTGLFTCSRCHDGKTAGGKNRPGIITNKALHVDGIAEVSFKPIKFRTTAQLTYVPEGWKRSGRKYQPLSFDESEKELTSITYMPEEKRCLNVACHLTGTDVKWGDAVGCFSCHRDVLFR